MLLMNPEKDKIIGIITTLWKKYPQMRLGQLLINYGYFDDKAVYGTPDKELLENLDTSIQKECNGKHG